MIMTKGKDVFWGIYAAIIPYVFRDCEKISVKT